MVLLLLTRNFAEAFVVPPSTTAVVVPASFANIPSRTTNIICHSTKRRIIHSSRNKKSSSKQQQQQQQRSGRKSKTTTDKITEEDDAAFDAWLQEQKKKISDPEYHVKAVSSSSSHHHHRADRGTIRQGDDDDNDTMIEADTIVEDAIKISASSFKFMEGKTVALLQKNPLVALAIFASAGLIVAYMLGFVFLEGYISSPNPYENGAVPYFEDLPEDRVLPDAEVVKDTVDSMLNL